MLLKLCLYVCTFKDKYLLAMLLYDRLYKQDDWAKAF